MLTREQCRKLDQFATRKFLIPSIVLMENAGRNCAEELLAFHAPAPHSKGRKAAKNQARPEPEPFVVVCCGSGNNGGDGFVIARHLHLAGMHVKVILFTAAEKYQNDARINLRIIERFRIPIMEFNPQWSKEQIRKELENVGRHATSWIVDAILGTGSTGELSTPLRTAVEAINECPARKMAVDIPTGLDCDTGQPMPIAVKADLTCTFFAAKNGFSNPNARLYVGAVKVIKLGTPFDGASQLSFESE